MFRKLNNDNTGRGIGPRGFKNTHTNKQDFEKTKHALRGSALHARARVPFPPLSLVSRVACALCVCLPYLLQTTVQIDTVSVKQTREAAELPSIQNRGEAQARNNVAADRPARLQGPYAVSSSPSIA